MNTNTSDGENEVFVGIDSRQLRSFLESIPDICSGISIRNRFWNLNRLQNQLRNRSRFRHLHKNRSLGPMIQRFASCKEINFFVSETSYFNSRTDSHSRANSNSNVNSDYVSGANCATTFWSRFRLVMCCKERTHDFDPTPTIVILIPTLVKWNH